MNLIITSPEDLKKVVKEALIDFEKEKQSLEPEKLYYKNQVAKMLGKSFATIKKLAENGTIRTTASGLISRSAIEEYLRKA
jgi:hypothetical protein